MRFALLIDGTIVLRRHKLLLRLEQPLLTRNVSSGYIPLPRVQMSLCRHVVWVRTWRKAKNRHHHALSGDSTDPIATAIIQVQKGCCFVEMSWPVFVQLLVWLLIDSWGRFF